MAGVLNGRSYVPRHMQKSHGKPLCKRKSAEATLLGLKVTKQKANGIYLQPREVLDSTGSVIPGMPLILTELVRVGRKYKTCNMVVQFVTKIKSVKQSLGRMLRRNTSHRPGWDR